jgi:mannose-1-phosphate guanylyltransferase/mannose-1-phosphate guanylyltransferase/mannose-6-phosphate isomerase
VGKQTMLQMTALRTLDPALFAPPLLVTNARHREVSLRQLEEAGITPSAAILEPVGRNTAPALALAAACADPDAILLALPSDQLVQDEAAFHEAVRTGLPLAADGWSVAFGITPTNPETGYGYIEQGEALGAGAFQAARFVEKPDLATARSMLAAGRFLWNGGIFMFRAGAMLDALEEHAPAVLAAVRASLAQGRREDGLVWPDESEFARSPAISIDYAVMERISRIAVVPVTMGWSDVGSWIALGELLPSDENGNAILGDVVLVDSGSSIVRSTGPTVAAVGISGLVIVATPDAVLVMPADRCQDLKRLVDELKARDHPTLDSHPPVIGSE